MTTVLRTRISLAIAGILLALTAPVLGATAAHADPPPKPVIACMDTIDQAGCPPHQPLPINWIADQYYQSGRNLWGDDFHFRWDGKDSSPEQAERLARDLGYAACDIPWWTNEVRCWGTR